MNSAHRDGIGFAVGMHQFTAMDVLGDNTVGRLYVRAQPKGQSIVVSGQHLTPGCRSTNV